MAPHPGPPLRKVTLNLYEEDCLSLEQDYQQGWTVAIRNIIHNNRVRSRLPSDTVLQKLTLGDLL